MVTELRNSINYLTYLPYISAAVIQEYDISKANINILLAKNVIDKDLYDKLYKSSRMTRQITIGKMIKNDKNIEKVLNKGIIEYKNYFYDANNINDEDIISIHNDSIFLCNKTPIYTKFDNVEFKHKGTYSSFYHVNNLEIYYLLDLINDREDISIKGITDDKIKYHENYFLEFLLTLFSTIQSEPIENAIFMIKKFTEKYLRRELDVEYYREFNSGSQFRFGNDWLSDGCEPSNLKDINILNNLLVLRELHKIIADMYFLKI